MGSSAHGFVALLGTLILLTLGSFVHVIFIDRKKNFGEVKKINNWYSYILFILISLSLPTFVPSCQYHSYSIPAGSMLPNIKIGDRIMVNGEFTLERGNIYVFKYPVDPNVHFIKRII
jgi:signal peptidase I